MRTSGWGRTDVEVEVLAPGGVLHRLAGIGCQLVARYGPEQVMTDVTPASSSPGVSRSE